MADPGEPGQRVARGRLVKRLARSRAPLQLPDQARQQEQQQQQQQQQHLVTQVKRQHNLQLFECDQKNLDIQVERPEVKKDDDRWARRRQPVASRLLVSGLSRTSRLRRTSCLGFKFAMKPFLIAVVVGLSVLAILMVWASNSLDDSSAHKQQDIIAFSIANSKGDPVIDFVGDANCNDCRPVDGARQSWLGRLVSPVMSMFGTNDPVSPSEEARFLKVRQGFLNQKRKNTQNQVSAKMVAHPPATLTSSGGGGAIEARSSLAQPGARQRQYPAHKMQPDQLMESTDATLISSNLMQRPAPASADNTPIQVDKVKGLDLTSMSQQLKQGATANLSKVAVQTSPSKANINLQQFNYGNVKCTKNKFDRVIAQKLSMNEISRPVIMPDGRYNNPFPTWSQPALLDVFKFMALESDESNVPKNKDELEKELPLVQPNFRTSSQNGDFRVSWIGHSTLVIQVDGLNILTDPVFSDRASPVQFVGPKRIREPACDVKSLPRIDIVLISHNHYDHLDANSVRDINERFGNECRWIVPLGIGDFLKSMSVENYVELDWWQKDCHYIGTNVGPPISAQPSASRIDGLSHNVSNPVKFGRSQSSQQQGISDQVASKAARTNRVELDIYLTPSQHWSRRGVNDVNKSLWGSFTIVSGNGSTFFFGGDTGYCSAFKEIAKVFGPMTGAAIPIGAYKPRWFLKPSHVDPAEAVQIHKDLKSTKSIAIHHSTFVLSNEPYREPSNTLREIMAEQMRSGLVKEPFLTLKHGESVEFCKTNC